MATKALFADDAYLSVCEAKLVAICPNGGLIFDQTCFYANFAGQPGDTGFIERIEGSQIRIQDTRYLQDDHNIVHIPAIKNQSKPIRDSEIGNTFFLHIDWPRRYRLMRMHSASHLLAAVCTSAIRGAQLGEDESWIEFEEVENVDMDALNAQMAELVTQNHPISSERSTEENLNTKQPSGMATSRFVYIGKEGEIDAQSCNGTHVSETQEIGDILISKIEKKNRKSCCFQLRIGPA